MLACKLCAAIISGAAMPPLPALPMSWIEPPGEAGNARAMTLCVHSSRLCRTGAHMIFAVTPSDPASSIIRFTASFLTDYL